MDVKTMTFEQKVLRNIIVGLRNEIVGGYENAYSDNGEEEFLNSYGIVTKEDIIEEIYGQIMRGNSPVVMTNDGLALERKHIKFMGEKFVRDLITDRVEHDLNKNGWDFPHEK